MDELTGTIWEGPHARADCPCHLCEISRLKAQVADLYAANAMLERECERLAAALVQAPISPLVATVKLGGLAPFLDCDDGW